MKQPLHPTMASVESGVSTQPVSLSSPSSLRRPAPPLAILLLLALLFAGVRPLVGAPVGSFTITEFLAANQGPRVDEDGEASDWIEIYNASDAPANLEGWYLTDDAGDLTQWRFPSVELEAHGYLLVYASGKNRTAGNKPLHTNFRLDGDGEYLALIQPDGSTLATEFAPTFPSQVSNVSYGTDRLDPSRRGYLNSATPGAPNSAVGSVAPEPVFSLESGVYADESLSLSITSPPGTVIRYTTDGNAPTNGSSVYVGPIIKNPASSIPGTPATFYVTTVPDTDGDGLPDDFELSQGLNPNDANDASLDPDRDGMSNGAEYIAGTDPQDALSYLRIEPPSNVNGIFGPTIRFPAIAHRTYTVEARDSLDSGSWRVLAEITATPTNRVVAIIDPQPAAPASKRIYRLVTPQQSGPTP